MIGEQDAIGRHLLVWVKVVIDGFNEQPVLATTGIVADQNRGLGIHREADDGFVGLKPQP